MGSKHFRIVADFHRADASAVIQCPSCRYQRQCTAMELISLLGARTTLNEAVRRLRCGECGQKGSRIAPMPNL